MGCSVAASAINTTPVLLQNIGSGARCLGYPSEVPKGHQDVVITVASCLGNFRSGGVQITLNDGSKSESLATTVPQSLRTTGKFNASNDLAAVTFFSGTVEKAKPAETLLGRASLTPLSGSPLLGQEKGDLIGLTRPCQGTCCEVVDLTSEKARAFLSQVSESTWGREEAPIEGDSLFRFGRHRGGHHHGGGGGFVYYGARAHVSINIVIVNQVYYAPPPPPPVIINHITYVNNVTNNNYCTCPPAQTIVQNQNNHQHVQQPQQIHVPHQPQHHHQVVYRAPEPPPIPAYIGYYVGGSESYRQELQRTFDKQVAPTGEMLVKGRTLDELQVAYSLPNESLKSGEAARYAANLRSPSPTNSGTWIADRAPRTTSGVALIAQSGPQSKESKPRTKSLDGGQPQLDSVVSNP